MNKYPFVSIITTNWNGRATTLQWLSDLSCLNYPKDKLEIIIHDNASKDGSQEALRSKLGEMRSERWKNFVLVESAGHPGLCEAYNRAFALTASDSTYVLHIDNDVRLETDTLLTLVQTLELCPSAVIAGCRVVLHDKPWELQRGAIFWNWWGGNDLNVDSADVCQCDAILDCVMLVRKRVVEELGCYFDRDLFFFCLGADLCGRVKRIGYKVLYNPNALAYHKTAVSTRKHPRLTKYLAIRDGTVFMKRHNRFPKKQVFFFINTLAAIKQFVFNHDWLVLQAMMDGFRENRLERQWWEKVLETDYR